MRVHVRGVLALSMCVCGLAGAQAYAVTPAMDASDTARIDWPEKGYRSLNRPMASLTDPNRDPNWDWTLNVTYDLQTTSQTYTAVRLPYYANSGPASVLNVAGDRDIAPEDGWRLILRDFGPGAVQAFFILYNRHRGTLRVFYYHPNNVYSHAVGKLSFQQATGPKSAALLTLSDSTDRYWSTYPADRSVVSVGSMGNGWCYMDFDASGYDPELHLKDDPTFTIQITGVTSTSIVLSGTIDLIQRTAAASRNNSGGFNATDVIGAYQKVAQRYKDVEDARAKYAQMAQQNPSTWWGKALNGLGSLLSKKWISALGPVAGFLELALGGGSRADRQPAPMIFDGTLQLNGTLTTLAPLYVLTLRVPGSHHIDVANDELSNVLPLYDVPLGVFNVAVEPAFALYHRQTITDRWANKWSGTVDVNNTVPLVVEANLNVFTVTDSKAAYTVPNWATDDWRYRSVGSFNNATVSDTYTAYSFSDPLYSTWYTGVTGVGLAVKVTLTPIGAAAGLEPVTVIKTYKPTRTTTNGLPPAFPARPPARPSSLLAVPGGITRIDLRWIDNAANENNVLVERRLAGTGTWAQVISLSANTTAWSDTSVSSGTAYDYRVRASGTWGTSAYSNVARTATP